MEPSVESILLHPAVLISCGYDCISSKQVRFLNAHRQHFQNKGHLMAETLSITAKDFELGGILNPRGLLDGIEARYYNAAKIVPNFPYLNRREVLQHFYHKELTIIWSEMMIELIHDLSSFCINTKRSQTYFTTSTRVIHDLYPHPIYQKIAALHLCGLGSKLLDAFEYVFRLFKSQVKKSNQQIALSNTQYT